MTTKSITNKSSDSTIRFNFFSLFLFGSFFFGSFTVVIFVFLVGLFHLGLDRYWKMLLFDLFLGELEDTDGSIELIRKEFKALGDHG